MKYLALLTLASSCAFAPNDATPLDPPAHYRELWNAAQSCTGRSGKWSELRFYIVPGDRFNTPDGDAAGRTERHNIYLAEVNGWRNDRVVKHEMIHALGVDGHPTHPFVNPCDAR